VSDGKQFEHEMHESARLLHAYDYNSNSSVTRCDWSFTVPLDIVHRPSGDRFPHHCHVLIENKDCSRGVMELGRVTTNERKHMDRHANVRGLSLVLVKHHYRAWACEWDTWNRMELERGWVADPPPGQRRKPGTGSIFLTDNIRPVCLFEIPWVPLSVRSNSKYAWDLRPIIVSTLQSRAGSNWAVVLL